MEFAGSWPRNAEQRFFFLRYNFKYIDKPYDRPSDFASYVVNERPMSAATTDANALKGLMMDEGIGRRTVPQYLRSAVERGEFEKVVSEMSSDGMIKSNLNPNEAEVSEGLPEDLSDTQPKQGELFNPDELKKTRRPWGHWMSWYGRSTMKRESSDEQSVLLDDILYSWERDEYTPEQFAQAVREIGKDPKLVDLGSLGRHLVFDDTVYDIDSPDSGKSISDFIWGLNDFALMQYAEERGISSDAWSEIGEGAVAYHGTDVESVKSIMENGLNPSNKSRSISNRSTGAAVFMAFNPEDAEGYGDVCLEINLGAMKNAGITPELQQEDPIIESKMRGVIAWLLGDQMGDWGESELSSEGINEDTLVMFGAVPPRFIRLYSGPDELMSQYGAAVGVVKTAVTDEEILEYDEELSAERSELRNIEEIRDEYDEEEDGGQDMDRSSLFSLMKDVFESSAKLAQWRSSGNPMDLRRIERLEPSAEVSAEIAVRYITAKLEEWMERHDIWDSWWTDAVTFFMSNGVYKVGSTFHPVNVDIRDQIVQVGRKHLLDQIYSFPDEFPNEIPYWIGSDSSTAQAFASILRVNNVMVREYEEENETTAEEELESDAEGFISELGLEDEAKKFAVENDEQFERYVRDDMSFFQDFDDLKEKFQIYEWAEVCKQAAREANAYDQWKQGFPGIEETEEGIRRAIQMLKSARNFDQKVQALSYALNVEHYFGKVITDRMSDEDLSDREIGQLQNIAESINGITPLEIQDLDELSNVSAAFSMFLKTAQTWYRGQVFVDHGETYNIDTLIDTVKRNHVVKIPVSDLKTQLFDEDVWAEAPNRLSPMMVMTNPTKNKLYVKHMQDIRVADMQHPIIIRKSDMKIVDGYHRLARAFLEGRPLIKAVFAEPEQMNACRIL